MMPAANAISGPKGRADDQVEIAERALLGIAGSMFALVGVIIAAASIYSTTDAATLSMPIGFGLILSGALLAKRSRWGVWSYMGVFVLTVVMTIHDMGGLSLSFRLLGPVVMLMMIAGLMPALARWTPRRSVNVCTVLIATTILVGFFSIESTDPPAAGHLEYARINGAHP